MTKQSLFAGKDCFAALLRNKIPGPCSTPWIPASAGMVMYLRRTLDDEIPVGATLVVALTWAGTRPAPTLSGE